ncbi:OmpA family protein [Hymenobacter sp. M29]|uniref:OmpA family protein n=1 Tax=Hymenobacter mellowenesis TaxID=3063995 RepID=A0ABT9ADH3_9BACT|nr:OmpA family protein [Hymenobacter sp. M29]MDO7847898.1 OmpA family protein [Hymenobacter sp. M29]
MLLTSELLRMKAFLALVLVMFPCWLRAQPEKTAPTSLYTDAQGRYQLSYPRAWQLRRDVGDAEAAFYAPATGQPVPAVVTLIARPLPDALQDRKLTAPGAQDSLWRSIRRLSKVQVVRLEQKDYGRYEEVRYEYTYAPNPAQPARTRVAGRRIWRVGYEFQVEYRAETSQDARYLSEGQQLLDSFTFTDKSISSRRYADQVCDSKMYGIAAVSRRTGQWEDDCRTIHEFSTDDISEAPTVHREVLPFQSYALAKGFDNCLYSVTKAPTDRPELVYRYDPAARRGAYTTWQLPAQGLNNIWISAATDERGDLYFLTSDAKRLVKVSPSEGGAVTVVWTKDPTQLTAYYPDIAFPGAGTHGNFCLDATNTMYLVYSTDGSLLKVDVKTQRPFPELLPLTGLPKRGGYSDLLLQNDESGRRRLYLAGPHSLYKVDLARQKAHFVRRGTYTDLAGCNVFHVVYRSPPPLPSASAPWRGRVLNAATYQPLPATELHIGSERASAVVPLSAEGSFSYGAALGKPYYYRAQLPGFVDADSSWTMGPGAAVHDILLRPLAVGTTLPLANVQFEQGQAVLLPTSFTALNQLVELMTTNPGLTIEVRGHTDNVGEAAKNVALSEERVAAVKTYLTAHGVAAARITGIGFGGAKPAASNAQEITRKLNRRVEFRVTGV